MITKDILATAKQYLCWDLYQDLSLQLIETEEPVSYFFAPQPKQSTILLFLKSNKGDYRESLFLLFHEVGHYLQYTSYVRDGLESSYWQQVAGTGGTERLQFEFEAWDLGKKVLIDFFKSQNMHDKHIIRQYKTFAERSLNTYQKI